MNKTLMGTVLLISNAIYAEGSDLNQSECDQRSAYCQWNSEQNICEETGGGGGNIEYGPYEFALLTETEGMPSRPFYNGDLHFNQTKATQPNRREITIPAVGEENGQEEREE
jgi:hypothetical protein